MLKIYLSQENFYKKKKFLEGKKYVFTNYAGNTKKNRSFITLFLSIFTSKSNFSWKRKTKRHLKSAK